MSEALGQWPLARRLPLHLSSGLQVSLHANKRRVNHGYYMHATALMPALILPNERRLMPLWLPYEALSSALSTFL